MKKMQGIKRLMALLMTALLALSPLVALAETAQADDELKINYVGKASIALKVRVEPNKNARGVDSVPKNATVYVLELVGDEWAKIKTDNTTGYVLAKYIAGMRDVSDLEQAEAKISEAAELLGGLDMVVNNAGIFAQRNEWGKRTLLETTVDEWESVMKTNTSALFFIMQAAVKYMLKHDIKGNILNVTSVSISQLFSLAT